MYFKHNLCFHIFIFSTKRIDTRLGHFQKTFNLTGKEVRLLTTKQPRLITYSMHHIKLNTFSVKEEMGFDDEQMKEMLLTTPNIWMMSKQNNNYFITNKLMKVLIGTITNQYLSTVFLTP